MRYTPRLAFDRSTRVTDVDGRLHVGVSNISKAAVNPYRGSEIPGAEELGLDPGKVYYLLRDPDELAKAAPTFNNLPVLSRHVPVSADAHQPDLVVGSTGTDAAFNGTYLTNSLVVWAAAAIAGIYSKEQQELSSAYRYEADMTPGVYKGLHFDGIMRHIVGNHVALVEAGRAGPDVVVGDSQLEGFHMLKSRRALMLSGALSALIAPKLAQDQRFDPSALLTNVTRRNYSKSTAGLAARIVRTVTPKLAQDEGLDVDDVVQIIEAVQGVEGTDVPDMIPDEPPVTTDDDGEIVSRICAMLEGKIDADLLAEIAAMGNAPAVVEDGYDGDDDLPKPTDKKDDKPAMDAKTIRAATIAEMNAIRQAERDVRPHVGEIAVAMDSAAAVYKLALDAAKVDLTGVPESAYGAMVKMLPAPTAGLAAPRKRVAMDAAANEDFAKRFPTAGTLKRA